MHHTPEHRGGTLTQRLPRDDPYADQVTVDFGHIDDDPAKNGEPRNDFIVASKYKTIEMQRPRRLSVALLVGLFCLLYLFIFKSRPRPEFQIVDLDVPAIEEHEEPDDRIKVMTYQPLTYEGQKQKKPRARKKRIDRSSSEGHNEADDIKKYHKLWVWTNASINIHELFPDTPDVDLVLEALATAPITHVETMGPGDYESGTSQKWLVTLAGGQQALIKLAWEEKKVMKDNAHCNYGYEMPWSEVAAFHLHRTLGFRNTPYVVGRKINLQKEIVPHASEGVRAQLSTQGGLTCVTGKCHFCKESKTICPPDGVVTASVAYWVPRQLKLFSFPPKYMPYSLPNEDEWSKVPFNNKTYCDKIKENTPYDIDRYFHDLFDFAVVDAMSYHFDSKHYIMQDGSDANGLTVRLDHGRAFCASDRDDENFFLAPIYQCCMLRWETWWALKSLTKGALRRELKEALAKDKTWGDLLHEDHFVAMERRLQKIIDLVEKCVAANGAANVFVG